MNVEYVGTINNQKLTTKILFVKTFFMEPYFTNWALHPLTILFFCRNFDAKNCMYYCQLCDSLIMTAGFTVPLGVVGVYIRT